MSCTGPCKQGRIPCPTPYDCEMPDNDKSLDMIGVVVIYSFGVAVGGLATWFLLRWL